MDRECLTEKYSDGDNVTLICRDSKGTVLFYLFILSLFLLRTGWLFLRGHYIKYSITFILFTSGTLFFLWLTLSAWFNRILIVLKKDSVTVRDLPIPRRIQKSIEPGEIEEVYLKNSVLGFKNDNRVTVRFKSGKKCVLIKRLSSSVQARFIHNEILKYYRS